MKGDKKRKQHGFQVGHPKSHKDIGRCHKTDTKNYLRVSKEEYRLLSTRGPGVDTGNVSEGGNIRLLRPNGSLRSELKLASETLDQR
jgi:hypothetical protein